MFVDGHLFDCNASCFAAPGVQVTCPLGLLFGAPLYMLHCLSLTGLTSFEMKPHPGFNTERFRRHDVRRPQRDSLTRLMPQSEGLFASTATDAFREFETPDTCPTRRLFRTAAFSRRTTTATGFFQPSSRRHFSTITQFNLLLGFPFALEIKSLM